MAALGSQTIAASYEQLLHVDTDGGGNTTTLVPVKDGDNGTTFAMQLSTTTVCIDDPTTSSATQGGVLRLQSDDGAVMASGHRLGVIEFGGAEDTSSTITTGARIEALADATWSASENGADMIFYTTDGNASQSEVMRLTADSGTLFNNDVYTANGTGLIVGNTAQVAMGEVTAEAQILGTTETDATLAIGLWSTTDALSPSLKFVKGANASIGTHSTTVADNEELGKIQAYGSDTTDSDTLSSEIAFNIDDDGVGAGTLGGEMLLKTSGKDGTLDTAVSIGSDQAVDVVAALTSASLVTDSTIVAGTEIQAGTQFNKSGSFTGLADDAAFNFSAGNRSWVFISSNSDKYGIFHCNYNTIVTVHNTGITVDTSAGTLTGTTGGGGVTIRANAGTFYVENRSGGEIHFGICVIAGSP